MERPSQFLGPTPLQLGFPASRSRWWSTWPRLPHRGLVSLRQIGLGRPCLMTSALMLTGVPPQTLPPSIRVAPFVSLTGAVHITAQARLIGGSPSRTGGCVFVVPSLRNAHCRRRRLWTRSKLVDDTLHIHIFLDVQPSVLQSAGQKVIGQQHCWLLIVSRAACRSHSIQNTAIPLLLSCGDC